MKEVSTSWHVSYEFQTKYDKINSSSHSPNCNHFEFASGGGSVPASKFSYQRNVCCPDISNNCQSARVSIHNISHRLSHSCCTCCQDNTSAEKQMQRFADLFRVTDILTGALGQPLFVSELIYRLTDSSRPHQIFALLHTLQDTSFGLLL